MPPQYQPYYIPPTTGFSPGPSVQPSQPVTIPAAQLTEAPDYLAYSIFTSTFCCIPLGFASLYYSLQTRKANRTGDFTTAQKNSILARNLAHSALGVGVFFIILCIIIVVVVCYVIFTISTSQP
ncbi:interferon-induced transmembrane protein 2-like [Sceloporus undulatus]|uniref:interferon-induced transmembrane protein 2-like n=1 Tax=Sceloporus undulatus TaxID=8520 RepID=UPI001C4B63A1|nr:interferon-induced transmembrane protein 2-like [Sceloporus undulatus]